MKKIIKLLILFFVIFPTSSKAYYNVCNNIDTVKLNKLASNILTNYTYTETNGGIKFNIILNNLNSNLYIYDVNKNQTYYSTGEIVLGDYYQKQTIEYKIYSNLPYCKGYYINSIFVKLPAYNQYYKDELCKDIEDYKLCKKWTSVSLNYDDFKKEIKLYKDSLIKKEENKKEKNKSVYEVILDFYIEYYYIILPLIIAIGGVVIVLVKRKQEKEEIF